MTDESSYVKIFKISHSVQKLRAHKDDQVDSQLTQINKNWLGPCPWCYPNDPCEWCREWSVTDHSRKYRGKRQIEGSSEPRVNPINRINPPSRSERLQVLREHFTQADLEIVTGKVVRPLVGAPWLKPFGVQTNKKSYSGESHYQN